MKTWVESGLHLADENLTAEIVGRHKRHGDHLHWHRFATNDGIQAGANSSEFGWHIGHGNGFVDGGAKQAAGDLTQTLSGRVLDLSMLPHRDAFKRNASPWLAGLAERKLGISAKRPIPEIVSQSVFAENTESHGQRGKVALFVDTFTHYYTPEVAEAAIAVLSAGGYAVEVLCPAADDAEPERPLCCGRTYLSQGMVDAAKREGKRVMAALAPALAAGTPIVGLEPSCLLALRDEFYSLSLGPDVGQLGKHAFLFEEFLMREGNKGLKLNLKPIPGGKAVVHGHCHQKAFGAMKSMKKVLGWIPEFEFEIVDASCCGMSGSFGLEAEHYEASVQMGELALLPAVRAAPADALIVADGFSCRHQIRDGSGREAVHVAVLLAQALA